MAGKGRVWSAHDSAGPLVGGGGAARDDRVADTAVETGDPTGTVREQIEERRRPRLEAPAAREAGSPVVSPGRPPTASVDADAIVSLRTRASPGTIGSDPAEKRRTRDPYGTSGVHERTMSHPVRPAVERKQANSIAYAAS